MDILGAHTEGSLPAAVDFTEVRFPLSSVLARCRNLYERRGRSCFMEEHDIAKGLRSLSQSLRRLKALLAWVWKGPTTT